MNRSTDAGIAVLIDVFASTLRTLDTAPANGFAARIAGHNGCDRGLTPGRVDGCRDLPAACSHMPERLADARDAVMALDLFLDWREAPHDAIPEGCWWDHAYVELVGPHGHIDAGDFRLGLYLQAPNAIYAAHAHRAEEFYMVLAGTADWLRDGKMCRDVPPGAIRHHPPDVSHATTTHAEPLLALWGWSGDIGFDSYRFV